MCVKFTVGLATIDNSSNNYKTATHLGGTAVSSNGLSTYKFNSDTLEMFLIPKMAKCRKRIGTF